MFQDRVQAGRALVQELRKYSAEHPVVLGLPRGGVPVAYEVAHALGAPLDVWVVRKLGAPGHEEYGLGAIAEGEALYVDWGNVRMAGASATEVEAIAQAQAVELARRVKLFRGSRPPPDLRNKTVILVDDGIATGGTVKAAIQGIRKAGARRIVLAVPVAAASSLEEIAPTVDAVVCPLASWELYAIGQFYLDFAQTSDAKVIELLSRSREDLAHAAPPGPG